MALLERGAANVEPSAAVPPHGVDVAGLLRWARARAAEAARGGDVDLTPPRLTVPAEPGQTARHDRTGRTA